MKATGDWVELVGTLITMYGLWFAWNRNSNRRLRRFIRGAMESTSNYLRHVFARITGRGRHITIQAATDVAAVTDTATVRVRSGIDPGRPLAVQIQMLAGWATTISNDLQDIRQTIAGLAESLERRAAEAESTAQQALSELRASARLDAATDLSIALFGIATTAVGIMLGMVADGRFSWLPW
ncbi:hypothetical protein [Nocardia sp. NRRL WC-3656]|uniref:hypothetical protein n=1 Tax=Nocardia sp. NRRL WC-3656 TaxID=1463824 RepID=UPI0004C36D06|nr:hypothetical protein [Nocardia sp. NRRL WC-3656]